MKVFFYLVWGRHQAKNLALKMEKKEDCPSLQEPLIQHSGWGKGTLNGRQTALLASSPAARSFRFSSFSLSC